MHGNYQKSQLQWSLPEMLNFVAIWALWWWVETVLSAVSVPTFLADRAAFWGANVTDKTLRWNIEFYLKHAIKDDCSSKAMHVLDARDKTMICWWPACSRDNDPCLLLCSRQVSKTIGFTLEAWPMPEGNRIGKLQIITLCRCVCLNENIYFFFTKTNIPFNSLRSIPLVGNSSKRAGGGKIVGWLQIHHPRPSKA